MKNKFLTIVSLALLTLFTTVFNSCLEPEDLVTDGVRVGGLVEPKGSYPYKLAATPSTEIPVVIPVGAGIKSILVYKQFFHNADTTHSNVVLLETVDVASGNASEEKEVILSYTWAELAADLVLPNYIIPSDELLSDIGDYWVLSYVAVMASDDKEIVNTNSTRISVANFFAGSYLCTGEFDHPVAGVRGINRPKDLVPISPSACETELGDLGASGYYLIIDIDPDTYEISLSGGPATVLIGDPENPSNECSYDPATGVITLYYYYVGSGGNRIIREVYTPVE